MTESKIKSQKQSWFNGKVLATVLLTKILILTFAAQSYQIITDQPISNFYDYFANWSRWDAVHYLNIAQNGYTGFGDDRFLIVFFPLYPALIALFQIVFRDYLIGAFIVSGIASLALGFVFRELVRLDYSEKIAQFSVLFLFIFPTSYFLHIPYTESLFLSLCIGSFLAARKRFWILAGIIGGLACLTRINGLLLFPALAFEVWNEYQENKKFNRKWLALLIIPFGFSIYLAINYYVAGSPTMFMTYQREHWFRYFRFPWESLWETVKRIYNNKPTDAQMTGVQEFLFVCIGLFAALGGWNYLRNSYRVWMVGNWLLFVSTSFVLSVPRYTLSLFPLFILAGFLAVKNWWANVLFTVWSVFFLTVFIIQFYKGSWAF
jgi:Gpi18-like mannosyltransferase